ncbi:MAG: hypothetical protein LBR83_08585 [Clostridiales bacterium]|jgi:hypothetical protein|nr:hypothetical protein [Clostridiales bacterium]
MQEKYVEYLKAVHQIFENNFSESYREANVKRRARLLPNISTIYRRWLYAALVENTMLTPANVMEALSCHFGLSADISPVIGLRPGGRFTGTELMMRLYDIADHPVIGDLRAAVAFCAPTAELCNDESLGDAQAAELSAKLSLNDPHYASYLIGIAQQMKLLVKFPSIYANRVQASKDCEARLSAPDETLFAEIVEASVAYAAYNLCDLIPLPEILFSETFIRSLLRNPMQTDEIFQRAYDLLGISLEDILDFDPEEEYDALDEAFISGTFMMGIALDKYFFTPFGYYLKLIRPLYTLPFDFGNEFAGYLEAGFEDEELKVAFFSPCSQYYFTDLGLKYFKQAPTRENYYDVKSLLTPGILNEALFASPGAPQQIPPHIRKAVAAQVPVSTVYSLKIRNESDTALWLSMDIPSEATLHRLYQEVSEIFAVSGDYSFYHGETESPFTEYVSPKRGKRAKKNTGIPLGKLDFEHQENLLLSIKGLQGPFNNASARFSLKMVEIKPREAGTVYPAVTRMSKKMRILMAEDE